ncbi:hypothetical protein [Helicobacter saguini]|uniref:hypothetical protein n=1 Tax=Helicobacter saguini TaxID=1548018 RepID=UPI000689A593|nr:hypothetical protein [Helicobacter saguini]
MYPYIDEILGLEWIIDLNLQNFQDIIQQFTYDFEGLSLLDAREKISNGEIIDPRSPKATQKDREKFIEELAFDIKPFDINLSNDMSKEQAQLWMTTSILLVKILAVTPPQGYPNAPLYYTPEYLERIYKQGKLDSKLDPRIPAIYRESFPQDLRDKIESFAKKHNIKN